MKARRKNCLGLTMIELMVVIAIVSFLSIIALGNYAAYRERILYARVSSDMRAIATALEAVRSDSGVYPRMTWGDAPYFDQAIHAGISRPIFFQTPKQLTTPVAYLSALPPDAFQVPDSNGRTMGGLYFYFESVFLARIGDETEFPDNAHAARAYPRVLQPAFPQWFRQSAGDYGLLSVGPTGLLPRAISNWDGWFVVYDPTNGTRSAGIVWRMQSGRNAFVLPVP